jgi:hypothetical protein
VCAYAAVARRDDAAGCEYSWSLRALFFHELFRSVFDLCVLPFALAAFAVPWRTLGAYHAVAHALAKFHRQRAGRVGANGNDNDNGGIGGGHGGHDSGVCGNSDAVAVAADARGYAPANSHAIAASAEAGNGVGVGAGAEANAEAEAAAIDMDKNPLRDSLIRAEADDRVHDLRHLHPDHEHQHQHQHHNGNDNHAHGNGPHRPHSAHAGAQRDLTAAAEHLIENYCAEARFECMRQAVLAVVDAIVLPFALLLCASVVRAHSLYQRVTGACTLYPEPHVFVWDARIAVFDELIRLVVDLATLPFLLVIVCTVYRAPQLREALGAAVGFERNRIVMFLFVEVRWLG